MKNFLLGLLARTQWQPFWLAVYRLALGGLGFVNEDPRRNGEDRFLRDFAHGWREARAPVIFDVGANEGEFTAKALAWLPGAQVHCFEPNARTFARLQARFAGSPQAHCHCSAIGEAPGELELYDYEGSAGTHHASLLKETFEQIYVARTERQTVRVTTIDAYLAETGLARIDYLKIDVEGLEQAVFAGMQRTIDEARVGVVQFEFNAHNAITGLTLYRVARLFPRHRLLRLLPNGAVEVGGPQTSYNSIHEVFKYANYVLLPLAPAGAGNPPRD